MSSPFTLATTAGSTAGIGLTGAAGWLLGGPPGVEGAALAPGGAGVTVGAGRSPAAWPAGLLGGDAFWHPAPSVARQTGNASRRNILFMQISNAALSATTRFSPAP